MSKHFLYPILFFTLLSVQCTTGGRDADKTAWPDSLLVRYYVRDAESGRVVDSVLMVKGDLEKSLSLYRDRDSLSKWVAGQFLFEIVKVEAETFAFLCTDSVTNVYQRNGNDYVNLFSLPDFTLGIEMSLAKEEVNGDGYPDLVLESASGGTHGDDYAIFLYHPSQKTLVYHPKPSLFNITLDPTNGLVTSSTRFTTTLYEIEDYAFKRIQETIVLPESDPAQAVVKDYDSLGHVTAVDTIAVDTDTENGGADLP